MCNLEISPNGSNIPWGWGPLFYTMNAWETGIVLFFIVAPYMENWHNCALAEPKFICRNLLWVLCYNRRKTETIPSLPCKIYPEIFFLIFIFREGGREKEGEKHWCVRESTNCFSLAPNQGPALNPGMRPDWKLNQQPFSSQAGTQSHQPGLYLQIFRPLST